MNQRRTFNGQWFIFGEAQPPAIGTLTFDPESGLTLEAQRQHPPDFMRGLIARYDAPSTIYGVDDYGTTLSLFGCDSLRWNPSPGIDKVTIQAQILFTGGRFNNYATSYFNTVQVNYSILDYWLLRSSVISDRSETGVTRYFHQRLPNIVAELPNDVILSISTNSQERVNVFPPSVSLTQKQTVLFEFEEALLTTEIRGDYIDSFGRLLSFLTGVEVFVDKIRFPQTRFQFRDVEWLHSTQRITSAQRERVLRPLIDYDEIFGEFPALISRWFQYQDRMEAVINLYFTAISNPHIPYSTRFLLLAQALEAYHGRSNHFSSEVQPRNEFLSRRDQLVAVVPQNEQDWLRDKLGFANQKTLADRLRELITSQQGFAAQIIGNTNCFADMVRWTRNYYTHYSQDEEARISRGQGRIAEGADLFLLSEQMRALLELHFVADLNLPAVAFNQIVRRTSGISVVNI